MTKDFGEGTAARPRVLVSQCLTGAVCRWDGAVVQLPFLKQASNWIEFVPVCPETGIGLGCPRPIIRLVRGESNQLSFAVSAQSYLQDSSRKIELVQPQTHKRLTQPMKDWSERILRREEPDGFLLKYKSPSCGLTNVRVYAKPTGREILSFDSGRFAATVREQSPRIPAIDDFRLDSPEPFQSWLAGIFAIRRFRDLFNQADYGSIQNPIEETRRRLKEYDRFYRPLLAALCPILARRLEDLIEPADLLSYFDILLSILSVCGRQVDYRPFFPPDCPWA